MPVDNDELQRLRAEVHALKRHPARVYVGGGCYRLRLPREADLCDDMDCKDCNREAIVVYQCQRCNYQVSARGKFVWSWQGKGHWHQAYKEDEHDKAIIAHLTGQCAGSVFFPIA